MGIVIRKGTLKDAQDYITLLQGVWRQMKNREWLYLDDPSEVLKMMEDGIMQLWVALDANRLAAAFDILIPGLDTFNYGYDLNFDEEALLRTVNMDTIVVHPDYRGLGLQRTLMLEAENWAIDQGYRTLICTVHPDNCYSLNNMLRLGYRIERKVPKYDSVRYVLRKELSVEKYF